MNPKVVFYNGKLVLETDYNFLVPGDVEISEILGYTKAEFGDLPEDVELQVIIAESFLSERGKHQFANAIKNGVVTLNAVKSDFYTFNL